MNAEKKPRARRNWLWIAVGAVVVLAIISKQDRSGTAVEPSNPAAKAASDKKFDETKIAALGLSELRAAMRNPDSFQLSSIAVMPKGAVCYEYRAQNGFGGMNVENAVLAGAVLKLHGSDGFASLWNRQCVGKTGRDITEDVRALMAVANRQ